MQQHMPGSQVETDVRLESNLGERSGRPMLCLFDGIISMMFWRPQDPCKLEYPGFSTNLSLYFAKNQKVHREQQLLQDSIAIPAKKYNEIYIMYNII